MKLKIKKDFNKSVEYLKESKKYIYSIVIIFFIFALIGYFIHIPGFVEKIIELIQEILEKTKDMSFWELTFFIFFNNLKVSIMGVLIGILLGIFPIALAMTNGYLLGFVASISVAEEGILSLWKILPHGIFELPAVFISLGLGLKLGLYVFFRRDKKASFKRQLISSLKVFLFIVVPLLILAAFIESVFIFLFR